MGGEIKLTTENNITSKGIPFPPTPPPEVYDDGLFPTMQQNKEYLRSKFNKLKRLFKPL